MGIAYIFITCVFILFDCKVLFSEYVSCLVPDNKMFDFMTGCGIIVQKTYCSLVAFYLLKYAPVKLG